MSVQHKLSVLLQLVMALCVLVFAWAAVGPMGAIDGSAVGGHCNTTCARASLNNCAGTCTAGAQCCQCGGTGSTGTCYNVDDPCPGMGGTGCNCGGSQMKSCNCYNTPNCSL
jgi:hypothetical protein